MRESIAEFMDRQKRRVERFGREAEAAAYEAYGRATRAGQDLKLRSQGDVMRHGVQLLQEAEDRAAKTISRKVQDARAQADQALRRAKQNPVVRSVAIDAARNAGNAAGVLRGGVHAVEGLLDGAVLMGRLADPLDSLKSAPSESAAAQLGRGIVDAGRTGAAYVQKGIANPQMVVTDVTRRGEEVAS